MLLLLPSHRADRVPRSGILAMKRMAMNAKLEEEPVGEGTMKLLIRKSTMHEDVDEEPRHVAGPAIITETSNRGIILTAESMIVDCLHHLHLLLLLVIILIFLWSLAVDLIYHMIHIMILRGA